MHKYIKLDYLELMADGDEDMKKTLLEMLIEELPPEITKMRQAVDAEDWEELSSVSHKMKSTMGFVGFEAMTAHNQELELLSKHEENPSRMKELVVLMEANLALVMPEIQAEFNA